MWHARSLAGQQVTALGLKRSYCHLPCDLQHHHKYTCHSIDGSLHAPAAADCGGPEVQQAPGAGRLRAP